MSVRVRYKFGLIGKSLGHSFSKSYHNARFDSVLPEAQYEVYELGSAGELPELLRREPLIVGLNVTIPFKQTVISFLDELDELSNEVGAVNTIVRSASGLMGFNTDVWGFMESLRPMLGNDSMEALVFGTGGSAKAVTVGLSRLGIPYQQVSRTPGKATLSYSEIDLQVIARHRLLINCTPVGMYPDIESYLPLPYQGISSGHIVFDLVYNPEKTLLLERSESQGATIKNGLKMLHLQADRSWEIWRQYLDMRI